MDLVMDHYNDASPDFITDVLLCKDDKPAPKIWEDGKVVPTTAPEDPKFIVLKWKKHTRYYGNMNHPCVIYSLVLMDGSETVFKAVTNSGLSKLMENHDICVGCTITVRTYSWVWLQSEESAVDFRGIMFITNMGWNYPPKCSPDFFPAVNGKEDIETSPFARRLPSTPPSPMAKRAKKIEEIDPQETIPRNAVYPKDLRVYHEVIDKCYSTGQIVFTHFQPDCPEKYRWDLPTLYPAAFQHFVPGDWIQCPETRCDWSSWMGTKFMKDPKNEMGWIMKTTDSDSDSEDSVSCGCLINYRWKLKECICVTMHPKTIDKTELFWTVKHRLSYMDIGESFQELQSTHQRWCLYWFYAVNVFQIRGDAVQLPSCLVAAVRKCHPNKPNERYTGFRSKEQRAERLAHKRSAGK